VPSPHESVAPAATENHIGPDSSEALDRIHQQAHALAATKPREAEPLFREALEGYRKVQGPEGALTLDLTLDLATLLSESGRHADAEPFFRAALEQLPKHPTLGDVRKANVRAMLGRSLLEQSKWTEAEPILREALAIREKVAPDHWGTFNSRSQIGGSLLGQKKYADAEPWLISGYEGMKAREATIPPPARPRLAEALERLVRLYEALGKKDEAERWRAEWQAAKSAQEKLRSQP
jgi:tetratricopeptide (TPR) repeat protein